MKVRKIRLILVFRFSFFCLRDLKGEKVLRDPSLTSGKTRRYIRRVHSKR